jgi:hypothetical protein
VAIGIGGRGAPAYSGGAHRVPRLGRCQHGRRALRRWSFRGNRPARGLRGSAGARVVLRLLAGLSALVAWLLVWEKLLDHPSANTYRWLLVAGGVLLLVAAGGLARAGEVGAREVATAGGIAAVSAGVLGVIVGALVGVSRTVTTALGAGSTSAGSSSSRIVGISSGNRISTGARHLSSSRVLASAHHASSSPHIPSGLFAIHTNGLQHFGWDVYLLILSLGLVWVGSRVRARGLGYVGGVGLVEPGWGRRGPGL